MKNTEVNKNLQVSSQLEFSRQTNISEISFGGIVNFMLKPIFISGQMYIKISKVVCIIFNAIWGSPI